MKVLRDSGRWRATTRSIGPAWLLGLLHAFPGAAQQVVRGPYLQLGTPTGAVVRWRTDVATASRLLYGPAPDQLTQSVTSPELTTEHELAATGLSPATRYDYAVADATGVLAGGDGEHFFVTSPAPRAAAALRAWVIGDSGTADENAAAVRDAYLTFEPERATDVWLMLGDNAYPEGTDAEYQAAVFDMYPALLRNTFLWSTYGNHDSISADAGSESGPYFEHFTLPRLAEAGGLASGTEAYYSFDWGPVHFVCLDSSESDHEPGGAMLEWLAADVAATMKPWLIAYWHHPPYTHGSHDSDDPEDSGGRLFDMRENALPILEAAGVDLVLSGHSHSYERSFLLDGHYGTSDTLNATMIVDGGDGHADGQGVYYKLDEPHRGTVYAVAGSSGKVGGGTFDHPVMVVSLSHLGSLVLDVDGGRLDGRFLEADGTVSDHFILVEGPRPELAIADAAVEEGDGGTSTLSFPLSLDATTPVDVTVDFATLDVSATAGVDYLPAAGTLTIPAGEVAAEIPVTVLGDTQVEADETFLLRLSQARNASLLVAEAVGTLIDDDDPLIFSDGFESGDVSAWTAP